MLRTFRALVILEPANTVGMLCHFSTSQISQLFVFFSKCVKIVEVLPMAPGHLYCLSDQVYRMVQEVQRGLQKESVENI